MQRFPTLILIRSGDGAIFSESFLHRGREGGRDAAAALNAALKSYVESYNSSLSNNGIRNTEDVNGFSTGRIMSPQIICTMFYNRTGLAKTLLANGVCGTSQSLQDFFVGFNQASPLFTLVDVGDGKEAADAKLRGQCNAYDSVRMS